MPETDYNVAALPVFTPGDANQKLQMRLVDGVVATQFVTIDALGQVKSNVSAVGGNAIATGNGATSSGTIRVTIANDSSGVIAVTQSTSPWITKGQNLGPIAPGAAASFSGLIAGVYNSSAPTATNGQQVALQTDANGNLKVTAAGGTFSMNLTQVAGAAIALGNTTMSASLPVTMASNQPPIKVVLTPDAATGAIPPDYNVGAAIAAGASSTHTYTVTSGKTLTFSHFVASSSAKMKIAVQVDLGAGLVTKFVLWNSVANPIIDIDMGDYGVSVASGLTVAIIRTNMDNQPQDLHSTVMGSEV